MCGIAGIYNLNGEPVPTGLLKTMTDVIAHRGPDGDGFYTDGPVGLGHRRLAIIDLSPAGRQPMANETADLIITYNGEVYNFQELQVELQALGHRFQSKTDSEVVVHAYEEWGEKCVERFNGMFAFAIYDRRRQSKSTDGRGDAGGELFIARDRYGVKPLYYFQSDGVFLFASEIKALLRHPAVQTRISYPALSEYFTFQNIFSDLTLFHGIRLLPPGCTLTINPRANRPVEQKQYWDFKFVSNGFKLSTEECAEELYRLFDRAVTRQLISDVPVGSYLSGGMDSGSITAVSSRHIPRIHTFSGGFDLSSASGLEMAFDERPAAEFMSNMFKTEHYEMVMHAGDMEHVLPELIWHLEDLRVGQCYPNYYIARLASKFVKVVLSGGGGDELFAGYPWRYYRGAHTNGSGDYYRAYYDYWQRLIPDEDRSNFFSTSTYGGLKDLRSFDVFKGVFNGGGQLLDTVEDRINASLYFELKTFLHGLFLVEDKVSMAHSLETRVPFMDNDLVDFAMQIPPSYKLRDLAHAPTVDEDEPYKMVKYQAQPYRDGKLILREAMTRLIPSDITTRAKQGFSAPDASWFRGESIQYINQLLRDPKAMINEFITREYVDGILSEHTSGRVNHRLLIWSLLSFEWWLRVFKPSN
ncbi:MAG TPA: asparagine synthase (glutamine-hydrolyzing) [Pyrinomonadaceae bacterium]|nr:asparagine synthase (glutamine-hydrolyzing) [Pyrinomonadaceae bacterium]